MNQQQTENLEGYPLLIRKVKDIKLKYEELDDELASEIVKDLEKIITDINAQGTGEFLNKHKS